MEHDEKSLYLLLGEVSADIKNILRKGTEQDVRITGHDQRLTALERFQWKAIGAYSAISAIVAAAIKYMN